MRNLSRNGKLSMKEFKEGILIGFIVAAQYFLPPLGGIGVAASLVAILILDYHERKAGEKLFFLERDVSARLAKLEEKMDDVRVDASRVEELSAAVASLRNIVVLNKNH